MADFNKLYETYTTTQASSVQTDVPSILSPYQQLFDINISEEAITLGKETTLLNTIPRKNICAIIDGSDEIYIILHASIYVLNKTTGKVNINIRNL